MVFRKMRAGAGGRSPSHQYRAGPRLDRPAGGPAGLDAGSADEWTAVDVAPYFDRALELFGPDRLMFGSDWPVANLRGGYSKVWRETNRTLARLSRDERDLILGRTAIAFYRLPINTRLP